MPEIKMLGKLPKELTKLEVENLAIEDIKSVIENGNYDLLRVLVELRRYDIYLTKLIETIKLPALENAKKTGNKNFNYADAKVIVTKTVSYDYSVDKIWSEINADLTNIKERMKKHQEFLKELDSNITEIIDESTGEVLKVTPPIKKEKDSLIIRL
jgi:hypothetical protein